MQFSLPLYAADWLPFVAAALTTLFGLAALLAPRVVLMALHLDTAPAHPEAVAEIRGTLAGFWLGTGIVALLFYDQPFLQMTLGAAWLFTGFGRLMSILFDAGATVANWALLALNAVLAALCLAPVLGFVPFG
ncbi:DUF4345 family protein [Aureimonas mangrovi]|uniref:AGROH133_08824 family phage infection protein n=1 Tax=Aureimonas mangrovi TaxID=2758041 RepID=UPI00163DBF57|nr:DUF4345 family protein [Aureimonas mangrovi]